MPLPDICVEDRTGCPNEWPTLRLQQQVNSTTTVTLRNYLGHVYELDADNHAVFLLTKQLNRSNRLDMVVQADITDGPNGVVSVTVTEADTKMPGIFLGEFVLFQIGSGTEDRSSSGVTQESSSSSYNYQANTASEVSSAPILYRFPAYVEVQINVQNMNSRYVNGSISIAELRMMVRDKCAMDNFLLDNVEFTDTEIAWAIRRPIDLWNDHPPQISRYTPATFPYRYYWLNAAVGELLMMVGANNQRNHLSYAAANLAVNDKDGGEVYMAAGQAMKQEYFQWMLREKKRINMEQMYGTTNLRAYGNSYYTQYGVH